MDPFPSSIPCPATQRTHTRHESRTQKHDRRRFWYGARRCHTTTTRATCRSAANRPSGCSRSAGVTRLTGPTGLDFSPPLEPVELSKPAKRSSGMAMESTEAGVGRSATIDDDPGLFECLGSEPGPTAEDAGRQVPACEGIRPASPAGVAPERRRCRFEILEQPFQAGRSVVALASDAEGEARKPLKSDCDRARLKRRGREDEARQDEKTLSSSHAGSFLRRTAPPTPGRPGGGTERTTAGSWRNAQSLKGLCEYQPEEGDATSRQQRATAGAFRKRFSLACPRGRVSPGGKQHAIGMVLGFGLWALGWALGVGISPESNDQSQKPKALSHARLNGRSLPYKKKARYRSIAGLQKLPAGGSALHLVERSPATTKCYENAPVARFPRRATLPARLNGRSLPYKETARRSVRTSGWKKLPAATYSPTHGVERSETPGQHSPRSAWETEVRAVAAVQKKARYLSIAGLQKLPAATYSPTQFPTQYHRR